MLSADRRPGFRGEGGMVMKHPRLRSEKVITTTFREIKLTRHFFFLHMLIAGFQLVSAVSLRISQPTQKAWMDGKYPLVLNNVRST